MFEAIFFYSVAPFVLGFGVLVITARNTVHSALFLVANFLCVALLFLALGAEFLAIIQVLVYAGGIVVLYLFVVMLVSLKGFPESRGDSRRRSQLGFVMAAAVLAEISYILGYSARYPSVPSSAGAAMVGSNTEIVGTLLYTDYLVPFEVASMLLLVAMIGAILLAKKEV